VVVLVKCYIFTLSLSHTPNSFEAILFPKNNPPEAQNKQICAKKVIYVFSNKNNSVNNKCIKTMSSIYDAL